MKHLYPHPFSGSNAVSLDVTVDFLATHSYYMMCGTLKLNTQNWLYISVTYV